VPRAAAPRAISCGVIVSDGPRVLIGHATRSPRWDIPKGLAEPGEDHAAAASRELREETGLVVAPGALLALGLHAYLPRKDLAVFAWRVEAMPEPAALRCASLIRLPDGASMPEIDRFAVLSWGDAVGRVGRNLARVIGDLRARPDWPFAPG